MSDASAPVTFERLLAHREWVRAVARSIAFDAATADDLEQETWLEALRSPPGDDRNLRGWLGTVLRNRARKRGRSGARRERRETAAASSGHAPPAVDLVAEAEAQQRIVAAVLALDEPYRTTILLRFYEGLPPRDVASRMDVPAETVRTRVRRAAARLREALGGGGGSDLTSWMGAIAPLLGAGASSSKVAAAATVGAIAVHTKKTFLIASLAALLFGGVCAWVLSLPTTTAPEHTVAIVVPPVDAGVPEEVPGAAPERRHVEPPPPAPKPEPVAEPEPPPPPPPTPKPEEPAASGKGLPHPIVPPANTDEPERDVPLSKAATRRAKVHEKYEEKGGYTFHDLVYWVDVEKLDDSRWTKLENEEPSHVRGLQLHARWTNEASAVEGMTIDVRCIKLAHERREGGTTTHRYSYPFDNLGESVLCSDMDGLIEGFYEDWKRGAKDVLEDQCEQPRKSKFKVPKLQAAAVGTDPASEQRERREWYAWVNGKQMATYVVEIRYGPGLFENEGLVEKGGDFVKNLKEVKDKVKWDDDDE